MNLFFCCDSAAAANDQKTEDTFEEIKEGASGRQMMRS